MKHVRHLKVQNILEDRAEFWSLLCPRSDGSGSQVVLDGEESHGCDVDGRDVVRVHSPEFGGQGVDIVRGQFWERVSNKFESSKEQHHLL